MSPGVGGHRGPCPQCRSIPQRTSGEGCLLKPKRTNPCAYTPPSLKGTGWRRLNGETEARGLCAVGWGHPGRLDPHVSPGAVWSRGETPVLPVPGVGVLTPAPSQRCSASCSPTWRVAWPGVTAPTGRPMTGSTNWPTPVTPTVPSNLVRGTGLLEPGRKSVGRWGRSCQSPGDTGTGMPEPRGCGDVGTGLPEPRGCRDMGTGLPEPRGAEMGATVPQ